MTGDPPRSGGAPEPLIALSGVSIGYRKPLLSGVDLDVLPGRFLGIVGPNGGGKTTLLRTILGLVRPLAGRVRVGLAGARSVRFGYVPQREQLDRVFPLRALDVVVMGRFGRIGIGRPPRRADRERAFEAMDRVGVGHLAARPFRDLSGGEQQRMLIARALAGDPDALVLDEPTAGMDLPGEGATMDLLSDLHRSGLTVLMVSHALATVANRADEIAFVNKDAGLFAVGPTARMLEAPVLRRLYGLDVLVGAVGRHVVVLRAADAGGAAPAEDAEV